MGLFGHSPLALGEHAYVDGYGPLRDHYCVRIRTGPDLSDNDRKDGPVFATDSGAHMWADYRNGTGAPNWDVNGVGKAV